MTFPPTLFPSPHEPALTREHVLRPQEVCGAVGKNRPQTLDIHYTTSSSIYSITARWCKVQGILQSPPANEAHPDLSVVTIAADPAMAHCRASFRRLLSLTNNRAREGKTYTLPNVTGKTFQLCPTIPSSHSKDPISALRPEWNDRYIAPSW